VAYLVFYNYITEGTTDRTTTPVGYRQLKLPKLLLVVLVVIWLGFLFARTLYSREALAHVSPPGCWLPSCTLNTCSEFTDFRVQNQLRRYRVVCSSRRSSTLRGRVLGQLSLSALSLSRAERERERGRKRREYCLSRSDATKTNNAMLLLLGRKSLASLSIAS